MTENPNPPPPSSEDNNAQDAQVAHNGVNDTAVENLNEDDNFEEEPLQLDEDDVAADDVAADIPPPPSMMDVVVENGVDDDDIGTMTTPVASGNKKPSSTSQQQQQHQQNTTMTTLDDVEEGGGGGGEGGGDGSGEGGLVKENDGIITEEGAANASSTIKKKKKKVRQQPPKREMNPKFKDVKETGHWGELSRREVYVAWGVLVAILVIVVAVVVAVVVTNKNKSSSQDDAVVVPAPTRSPTLAPTPLPASEELAVVLSAIGSNPSTASLLDDLPDDATFYEGLWDSTGGTTSSSATPQQQAMSWLLYEDTMKDPIQSVRRWAFASIFLQTGGGDGGWTSSAGWLYSIPVCDWEHVSCELNGNLQELDLDGVNLVAPKIPVELALLTEIQSILLQNNQIGGTIPADVFDVSNLPRLGLLYLNNNQLTGTVPEGLTQEESGGLHTFYVQFNNLTGPWPIEYCTENLSFREYGLDCDRVTDCVCCSPLNCYYSS